MRKLFQLAVLSSLNLAATAAGAEMEEYRVKALFLYNFTQFIEWPAESFNDATAPLTICILGPNPFEIGDLQRVVANKHIDTHPFSIRLINDSGQSTGCHIVFVCASSVSRARSLMGKRKQGGVLTVGENPGFAAAGGVVNLLVQNGRVRLEINVAAAEREKLHVSAQLLKLAEIVK